MDSDEDKVYKLIEKNPKIHQKLIIDKTGISNKTVKKILDKLRAEKRIFGQNNGKRMEFTVSDYYSSSDKLVGGIEEMADSLNRFVHSVTKKHREYHPETLERLYREISKMYKRLSCDIKGYEERLREDDDAERDKKYYRKNRREIFKKMDEIMLEGSLKKRVRQYQRDAGDLFEEMVSLLHGEKKRLRQMGGQHRQRPQTSDKIKRYDKNLKVLVVHQYGIGAILDRIKRNEDREAGYADNESAELAISVKTDRGELDKWQEKMTAYEEKIDGLSRNVGFDRLHKQKAASIAKDARERISDMRTNFDGLTASLKKLEIGVITDEHIKQLHSELNTCEKWLQENKL